MICKCNKACMALHLVDLIDSSSLLFTIYYTASLHQLLCFICFSVVSYAVGIHSWSLLLLKVTFSSCVGLVALHLYLALTTNKQQRM